MPKKYNFKQLEKKWSGIWEKSDYGKAKDFDKRPKHYNLIEFPYPSAAGLHVGHCMGYGSSDIYCRMKRMQGYNVLFPVGWDAFGLPTENYAIKTGVHPAEATKKNIDIFRKQMKMLGLSFDYDREVDTTDPDYYRWTQWIFLQFYKHAIVDGKLVEVADDDTTTPRMAYQAEMPINWCPACKIGLANEEVINGKCERCGAETSKKTQKQWMLRITAYADRLIDDLDTVEYLPKIKSQQVNWIGRSTGTNIKFKITGRSGTVKDEEIEVFTTRADTLYGCTYMVVSPEHPIIRRLGHHIQNLEEVEKYIVEARKKSDLERTELQKEKTGVKLYGINAINPINGAEIDVYVADYVLATYGTGAVMAVPAHDERDFEFAKKYNISIVQSIAPVFKVTSGDDAFREGSPVSERDIAYIILKHWSEDKYYVLDWPKFGWKSVPTGGIEPEEPGEESAKREVVEETGYTDIKSARKVGSEVHSRFYALHKNTNRHAKYKSYLVELGSGQRNEKFDEVNHNGMWLEADRVYDYINVENHKFSWDEYTNGVKPFTEYGRLVNSGEFTGLDSQEAIKRITQKLKENGSGDFAVNYKLRDWLFSRQHYWGEPIPIIHCEKCGKVPVPEDQLPVTLPDVENYQPTDTGESPLAAISDWVKVTCPACGGETKRETDTMPNWAGSSWYYLAYTINQNIKAQNQKGNLFIDGKGELDYWMPVDLYNGGMEHTTLHLLYSRFWHKFLYDLQVVGTPEPYQKRIAHGIILGPDGQKMSKSKGNVINPDDIVKQYGADALRAYIAFIGPYDQESAWNTNGLAGVSRFLNRVWDNCAKSKDIEIDADLLVPFNKLIKSVTEDIENYSLNTYIAKLMEFNNLLNAKKEISKGLLAVFLKLLSPACPFISEELWHELGNAESIFVSDWPEYDSKRLIADKITVVVQVNGKVRAKLEVPSNISDEELKTLALAESKVVEHLAGKEPLKVIVVPRKLVSIVI